MSITLNKSCMCIVYRVRPRISVFFRLFEEKKGGKYYYFKMKPGPVESLWKTLPGLRRALSLKLGKFVKIESEKKAGRLFKASINL